MGGRNGSGPRIAIIGAPGHSAPIRERLAGAKAALAAAGIAPVDVRIGTVHSFEACRDLVRTLPALAPVLRGEATVASVYGPTARPMAKRKGLVLLETSARPQRRAA